MLTKVKAQGRKIRTTYQSRLLPCRIHQDEPQYSGCGSACNLLTGRHYVHTGDFKVDYTRYSGMPSICSVSVRSEKRCAGTNVRQYKRRTSGIYHVRKRRSARHLMRFSGQQESRVSLLQLLRQMSTVCSRSSTPQKNLDEKWWSRDEAWSISFPQLQNLAI